jgi:hypothetical protein
MQSAPTPVSLRYGAQFAVSGPNLYGLSGSPTLWAASPTGTEATVWTSNNDGTSWRVAEPTEAGVCCLDRRRRRG